MLSRNINLHKENKKQQTQWHKKKKHKQLTMNRMQNNKEQYFVHEKRKQKRVKGTEPLQIKPLA